MLSDEKLAELRAECVACVSARIRIHPDDVEWMIDEIESLRCSASEYPFCPFCQVAQLAVTHEPGCRLATVDDDA